MPLGGTGCKAFSCAIQPKYLYFYETRKAGSLGGFFILGYQKSSAAQTAYLAGRFGEQTSGFSVFLVFKKPSANCYVGAAVGWGGPRFLVPQYEGDAPSGCCAAPTRSVTPKLIGI